MKNTSSLKFRPAELQSEVLHSGALASGYPLFDLPATRAQARFPGHSSPPSLA
jgi:hypothetical protein